MNYFGILTLLAIFFNEYVGLNDHQADLMVGVLTGGITLSMFFLGGISDKISMRKFTIISLTVMLIGRIIIAGSGELLEHKLGLWSPLHLASLLGILFIVIGYGIYMPGSYAAVRKLTSEKTSAMGYAMLYALMNLGSFLPGLVSPPIRARFGMVSVFWFYIVFTIVAIAVGYFLLTKKAVEDARKKLGGGKAAVAVPAKVEKKTKKSKEYKDFSQRITSWKASSLDWMKNHPLANVRFTFFIFILIPVQTLFAHQWLTLPQYVYRAFSQSVSDHMEFFVNLNPLLIFVIAPLVAAFTRKVNTYKMMIIGTFVMSLPTFFLAMGTNLVLLYVYIFLMSIGEALWQPRFLQWVAEIAPEGRTGAYMGIGQFPWFLTKVLTSLYAGLFLMKFIPSAEAWLNFSLISGSTVPGLTGINAIRFQTFPNSAPTMWLIYGFIAMISPVSLLLARKWARKGTEQSPEGKGK
jgi:POT family proton-dependent oligopeptide transporter